MREAQAQERYQQIAARLSEELSQKLFEHSVAVADKSRELADIHAPDKQHRARLGGLLHDNAKEWDPDRLTAYLEDINRQDELDDLGDNPQLYHAVVGRYRAEREFGVDDGQILEAVRFHTTGAAGMSLLAKLVFAADKVSEDREYEEADLLGDYADTQLDLACYEIVRRTLNMLLNRESSIATPTVEFYNELLRVQREWAEPTDS